VRTPASTPASTRAAAPARGGARISNPKAARAVRRREKAANLTAAQIPGDTHHGGHPVTVEAENTPSERARAKAGRQPAPMGAREPS
jgi:hypothetical protein